MPVGFTEPISPVKNVNPNSLVFWQHAFDGNRLSVMYLETRGGTRHVVIDAVRDTTVVPFGRPTREETGGYTAFRIVVGPDESASFYRGFSGKPTSFTSVEPDETSPAESDAHRCKALLELIARKVHSGDKTIFPLESPPPHIAGKLSPSRDGPRENFFNRIRRSGTTGGGSDLSQETRHRAVEAINHIFYALKPFSE